MPRRAQTPAFAADRGSSTGQAGSHANHVHDAFRALFGSVLERDVE